MLAPYVYDMIIKFYTLFWCQWFLNDLKWTLKQQVPLSTNFWTWDVAQFKPSTGSEKSNFHYKSTNWVDWQSN